MAEVITVPKMSEDMMKANIHNYYVKVGDEVQAKDVILELGTDHFMFDLEVYQNGVVLHLSQPESSEVVIGGLLAIIGEENEDISALLDQFDEKSYAAKGINISSIKAPPPFYYKPSPIPVAEYMIMPDTSAYFNKGKVLHWHIKIGNKIEAEDKLVTLQLEDKTINLNSADSGIIVHLSVEEGEEVEANGLLAIIGEPDTDIPLMLNKFDKMPLLPSQAKYELPRLSSGVFPSYTDCSFMILPQLNDLRVKKGKVSKWLVKKGQTIREGELIAEVALGSRIYEVPAYYKGTVLYRAPTNAAILCGGLVAIIGKPSANIQPLVEHFEKWEASQEVMQSKGGFLTFLKDLLPPYR